MDGEQPRQLAGSDLRSDQQNKAIHLYLTWLCRDLNKAGLPPAKVLRENIELAWTKDIVIAMAEELVPFLNACGSGPLMVFKQSNNQYWTMPMGKELLWRPVQIKMTGKQSTTQLTRGKEIDDIYSFINRHIGERFGVHTPFPNREDLERERAEREAALRRSTAMDKSV